MTRLRRARRRPSADSKTFADVRKRFEKKYGATRHRIGRFWARTGVRIVRTRENIGRFLGTVRTMRPSVRTTPELSRCNYISVFNTFRGSRTVCEAGTNADIARLCVYTPRGQRGTNICYVCELATLLGVLLAKLLVGIHSCSQRSGSHVA